MELKAFSHFLNVDSINLTVIWVILTSLKRL
jgi:hypothetical protein